MIKLTKPQKILLYHISLVHEVVIYGDVTLGSKPMKKLIECGLVKRQNCSRGDIEKYLPMNSYTLTLLGKQEVKERDIELNIAYYSEE